MKRKSVPICVNQWPIFLLLVSAAFLQAAPPGHADQPAARTDANSQLAHTQLLEKARKGGMEPGGAGIRLSWHTWQISVSGIVS